MILRKFSLIVCLFISTTQVAISRPTNNPLLKCLGQEELTLHKRKITGSAYHLNQWLISALINASSIQLKSQYMTKVCKKNELSTSLSFLKIMLLEGMDIFQTSKLTGVAKEYQLQSLRNFIAEAPHLFFRFLSYLQSSLKYPRCLREEIPELQKMLDRFQRLEDVAPQYFLKDKKLIMKIFKRLNKIDSIVETCKSKFEEKNKKLK